MLNDDDVKKIKDALKSDFSAIRADIKDTRADVTAHDQKFEELSEAINKLPTREEVQGMIDRTYSMAVLKAEHDRIKEIIREKLHVEV